MVNIDKFFSWFDQSTRDIQKFEAESRLMYQEICEQTHGWASAMKCNILHNALLCLENDEQYLEIGSYTGRSLVGALINNDKLAQVIDPFELFLPDGFQIYTHWKNTIDKYALANRVTLHKALCHQFDKQLPPIGVYYYDGDHDSGHTYEGLKKFERCLTDKAIIVVDDYRIFGGHGQRPYPGHQVIIDLPVKHDVDRWLSENKCATLVAITPWENHSAIIRYEVAASTTN